MQQWVWLSDEFSVRAETLCMRPKRGSDAGLGAIRSDAVNPPTCLEGRGHGGACSYTHDPDIRLYSHTEPRR